MPKTIVTLEEIALQMGVSKATVSLALRGRPGVSEATRQRVTEVAERLGYRPDPAVSSLAERRWRKGSRAHNVRLALLHHAILLSMHQLLEAAADRRGYDLVSIRLTARMEPRVLNRLLHVNGVHGVIIDRIVLPELTAPDWWEPIAWSRYSWVACNVGRFDPPIHRVINHALRGVQDTLKGMADHGYRRIAFIRGPESNSHVNAEQQAGFLQFQATHPELDLQQVILSPEMELMPAAIESLEHYEPEALLLGFLGLHQRLPKSLRNLPFASLALWQRDDRFAGAVWEAAELAEGTIALLDAQIRNHELGLPRLCHALMIDGKWWPGKSLPLHPLAHDRIAASSSAQSLRVTE